MKTKEQKKEELKRGDELFAKNKAVILADFSKVKAEDLRQLRTALRQIGAEFFVIKKRLLNLILKKKGIDFDSGKIKVSLGAIFAPEGLDEASTPVVKFFSNLDDIKVGEKILGAYDLIDKSFVDSERIVFLGNLPPREIILAQFFGLLKSPVQSLLYILKEQSKKVA